MSRFGRIFGPLIVATFAAVPGAFGGNVFAPSAWRLPALPGVELAQQQSPSFKPSELPTPKLKPGEFQGLKPDLPRLSPDPLQRQQFKAKDNLFDAKKTLKAAPDKLPDLDTGKRKPKEEEPTGGVSGASNAPPTNPGHDVYDLVKAPRGANDSRPGNLSEGSQAGSSANASGQAQGGTGSKGRTATANDAAGSQSDSAQKSASQKRSTSATGEATSCKSCRTSCSRRFRNDCEAASCKDKYTACMRSCWDKHCQS